MIKEWRNGLEYDSTDLFYKLNMANGESVYFDISNNLRLIPLAIGDIDVIGFQSIRKITYLLNAESESFLTLEGLEFKELYDLDDCACYRSKQITVDIDKNEGTYSVEDSNHERCYLTQELNRAVELKMVELGLWEEL